MDVSRSWEELQRPYWEPLGVKTFVGSSSSQSTRKSIRLGPKVTVSEALKQSKTNVKSFRVGGSRASRFAEMEAQRKNKRMDTHLANRGIGLGKGGLMDQTSSSTNTTASSTTTTSTNGKSSTSTSSNGTNGTGRSEIDLTTTTDARKKMLNKWKQEKNALQNKPVANNKPAFKPGGGVKAPSQPLPLPLTTLQARNKAVVVPPAPQPAQVERRVTRGMAKVNQAATNTTTTAPTASTAGNNKMISNQMKNLAISNGGATKKPPSQVENKPPISSRNNRGGVAKIASNNVPNGSSLGKGKPGMIGQQVAGRVNKSGNNKPAEKMEVEIEQSSQTMISPMDVVPPVAAPKKLKPQAIDSVYIEYTYTFVQAIKQLQGFSKYWRPIVDNITLEIPELVRDEIISSLGKVQLLLGSKLPQFAELLHSYLCKEITPFPILECDLQGWWDVAAIQVTQVCSDFDKLEKLEGNNWQEEKKDDDDSSSSKKNGSASAVPIKIVPSVKATAKASEGMKAFLAMKRKGTQQRDGSATSGGGGGGGETSADSTLSSSSGGGGNPQEELVKKFEGGFFVVSSPARSNSALKPDPRRASLRLHGTSLTPSNIPLPRTPAAGRRLSTNLSMRSLSLRNSMGPMYKLGAKGDANSDELAERTFNC